jgi:hypothetical protein
MRRLFASLGGLIGPCSNEKFISSPLGYLYDFIVVHGLKLEIGK